MKNTVKTLFIIAVTFFIACQETTFAQGPGGPGNAGKICFDCYLNDTPTNCAAEVIPAPVACSNAICQVHYPPMGMPQYSCSIPSRNEIPVNFTLKTIQFFDPALAPVGKDCFEDNRIVCEKWYVCQYYVEGGLPLVGGPCFNAFGSQSDGIPYANYDISGVDCTR